MSNDLRKAAQQALEALEELQYAVVSTAKTDDVSLYYRAIAALSAALEKPTCKQSLQVAEQQGPVAWMVYTLDGTSVFVTDNPADFTGAHRALPL